MSQGNQDDFSPELARRILTLNFPEAAHRRYEELAYKAQDGALTDDEGRELEGFVDMNDLFAMLKSRARARLREEDGSDRGSDG
jgi:hypothetical protein